MATIAPVLPFLPGLQALAVSAAGRGRFTLDGDAGLEARLAELCVRVGAGVLGLLPPGRLECVLLGGGYGRGEGGVARGPAGDEPYNDAEFWVFLRGPVWLNERRHGAALARLAHELSEDAGLEVEFKIASLDRWRREPVSMFSYDLVMGHRVVAGDANLLRGCEHHRRAADIPLAEATRLLLNRCTGLLLARQRLRAGQRTDADLDFIVRNVAKARLALGDAVLVAHGRYHWSCRERHRRLAALEPREPLAWLECLRSHHTRGVAFKLRPGRSDRAEARLEADHRELTLLASRVWLWLETRRLGVSFHFAAEYALHPGNKCPETSWLKNGLITMRRFGPRALFHPAAFRYPRERLLRALSLLLWQPALAGNAAVRARLQRDLDTNANDLPGFEAAYLRRWEWFR